MKKTLFLSLLLMFTLTIVKADLTKNPEPGTGNPYKLIIGSELKVNDKLTYIRSGPVSDKQVMVIHFNFGKYIGLYDCYLLDENMKMVAEKRIDISSMFDKKNDALIDIKMVKGKAVLVIRTATKSKVIIKVLSISGTDFKPDAAFRVISEVDCKENIYSAGVYVSDDGLVMAVRQGFFMGDKPLKILFATWKTESGELINSTLTDLANTKSENDISGDGVYSSGSVIETGYVSNAGEFHFITRLWDKNKMGYHFDLYTLRRDSKNFTPLRIDVGDRDIRTMKFYTTSEGIYIAGSYANDTRHNIVGLFTVKISDGKLSNFNYVPLLLKTIKPSASEAECQEFAIGQSGGVKRLEFRDISILDNGNISFVTEITTRKFEFLGPNEKPENYYYHTVVFNLSPKGTQNWQVAIYKKQTSFNQEGETVSEKVVAKGNTINIFYIENDGNTSNKYDDYVNKKDGVLFGIRIDEKGNYERFNLGPTEKISKKLQPREFKSSASKDVYGQDTYADGNYRTIGILIAK